MYIPVTFQHEWIPACAVPVAFAGNREIYQVWLYVSEHGFSSRIFIRNVYRSVTVRCKKTEKHSAGFSVSLYHCLVMTEIFCRNILQSGTQ